MVFCTTICMEINERRKLRSLIDKAQDDFVEFDLGSQIESYAVIQGPFRTNWPKLHSLGYKSISIKEIMHLEKQIRSLDNNVLNDFFNGLNYLSANSLITHPDGRVKIIDNSINPTYLSRDGYDFFRGSVKVDLNDYEKIKGIEFSKEDVEKYMLKQLSLEEFVENPFWLALVDNDNDFLNEFGNEIYARMGYNQKFMQITPKEHFLHPKFPEEKNLEFALENPLVRSTFSNSIVSGVHTQDIHASVLYTISQLRK